MPDIKKLAKLPGNAAKKAGKFLRKPFNRFTSKDDDALTPYKASSQLYPPPSTDHLPIPPFPLTKKKAPWYIQWVRSPERISKTAEDTLKFELIKGCHGIESGAAFTANPNMMLPADTATLTYSVFFPVGFDFVKGGQLPGITIGALPYESATGGSWSETGGSFRIMFRDHGAAIGYAYFPLPGAAQGALAAQNEDFKEVAEMKAGGGTTGIALWDGRFRGDFQLRTGAWNTVSVSVRLNRAGHEDGAVAMSVNGRTKSLTGVVWRLDPATRISAVNFVSFFGGDSDDWNSAVDTHVCFKDISFAAN